MKIDSLKAVTVTARIRPRLVGDTLEYNTNNMQVKPNATVEDMLRRLPAVRVEPNGDITYNGEKIESILVNGEAISGLDPSVVARNFSAAMIDRVQVLDRRSDRSRYTGVDDGIRTKTLNLILKESARHEYFVKLEAGGNPHASYDVHGILGSFRRHEQFTGIGLASSVGTVAVNGNMGDGQTGFALLGPVRDPLSASAGTGIPRVAAVAVHYVNSNEENRYRGMGDFQTGHLSTEPITNTLTQQILPDRLLEQNEQSHSINRQSQYRFNGTFDFLPDSLYGFKFSLAGIGQQGNNRFAAMGKSMLNTTPINDIGRTIQSTVGNQNLAGRLSFHVSSRGKPNRGFSLMVEISEGNAVTSGRLYSLSRYYHPDGILLNVDTTDQRKEFDDHFISLNGVLSYTEPLWPSTLLAVSYDLSLYSEFSKQGTYNKGDGNYEENVDSLSGQFQNKKFVQIGSVNLQGKNSHFRYTIGGNLYQGKYQQKQLLLYSSYLHSYIDFSPRILVVYTISPQSNLSFNYTSQSREPTSNLLHTVANNNNPLQVVLGNAKLSPSFTQKFELGWHWLRDVIINFGLHYSSTKNDFATRINFDSLGRQVSQPVNISGTQNAVLNFSINKRLESLGIDAGFHSDFVFNRSMNYVNTNLNTNRIYNLGGGFTMGKYVLNKYTIQLNTNLTYCIARSTINTSIFTRYWAQSHYGTLSIFPGRGLEIGTTALYTWQQKTSLFTGNTSVLRWNVFAIQNCYKNRFLLKVAAYNLLNENSGITRINFNNVNTETARNILGRYWMMSAIYQFKRRWKEN